MEVGLEEGGDRRGGGWGAGAREPGSLGLDHAQVRLGLESTQVRLGLAVDGLRRLAVESEGAG